MIPKTLKIGPFTYSVSLEKGSGRSNHGETSLETKEIFVQDSGNLQVVKETLQHEILHALLEDVVDAVRNAKDNEEAEETLIRFLSPRLLSFSQDNPKAAKYLWTDKTKK